LESIGLRYFNVFGPRQRPDGPYAAVVPRFFTAYRQGRSPRIFGDGRQSRDFTFVGDVVAANLLAAGALGPADGSAVNVGAGRGTTVLELAERIRALAGDGPPPELVAARPGDVRHSLADLTRAQALLSWQPRVSLEEGLAASASHFLGASPRP
jgi:nucleoside-diphosphate-sugar epimerase